MIQNARMIIKRVGQSSRAPVSYTHLDVYKRQSYAYVGFIYTLASVVGVAVQLPLVKWCKQHLHANESLALANILYGVGLAIMGLSLIHI